MFGKNLVVKYYAAAQLLSLSLALCLLAGCASSSREPPVMRSYEEAMATLQSSDSDARLEAVNYLGASGNPAAIIPVSGMLSDESVLVRIAATLALRNFSSPLAIEALRSALEDEDFNVSFSAAVALYELEDYSGTEVLIEGLSSPREEFRFQALMVLGKIRSRAAVPGIIELLKDPVARTRSTAAYILGLFKEESAIGPLLEAMEDPAPFVRKDAWDALREITGQNFDFPWKEDELSRNEKLKVWREWWYLQGQERGDDE